MSRHNDKHSHLPEEFTVQEARMIVRCLCWGAVFGLVLFACCVWGVR